MRKKIEWSWEQLDAGTARIKVIGGWIVCSSISHKGHLALSNVFVPDRDHEWTIVPPMQEVKVEHKKSLSEDF